MFRSYALISLLLLFAESSGATTVIKEYPFIKPIGGIVFQGDSLWVGAYQKGIVLLNTKTDSFRVFDSRDGLLSIDIRGVAQDARGNIWVGTNAGINVYRDGAWGFYTYINGELIGAVTALTSDTKGNIWVATGANNNQYSSAKIYKYDGATWTKIGEYVRISYYIWNIAVDGTGALWWGMGTEGLYSYQDGKWTSYPYLPHNLGDAISIDGAGNMWFCGFENQPNGTSVYTLYKFDIDSQSFQTFPIPRMWEFGAQYLWTNKFAITDKGILWCASYWGISAFDGRYWYGPYLNPEDRRGATYCTVDPRQRVWFFGEDLFYVDGNDIPKEGWPGYSGIYEDTPLQLSLRNSPNPFNPSTTLSFSLPRTGNTLLSIYSITGQKVCTLVSGPMSAGKHSVVWDGRDDSGNLVSSGVYLSRLETGKLVSTAKMLLMK